MDLNTIRFTLNGRVYRPKTHIVILLITVILIFSPLVYFGNESLYENFGRSFLALLLFLFAFSATLALIVSASESDQMSVKKAFFYGLLGTIFLLITSCIGFAEQWLVHQFF